VQTIVPIPRGEELLIDYGEDYWKSLGERHERRSRRRGAMKSSEPASDRMLSLQLQKQLQEYNILVQAVLLYDHACRNDTRFHEGD
jgi:hypothetical protein